MALEYTSEKAVLSLSLLYAIYTVVKCPCDPLCECNKVQFYLATGIPLAYIIYQNELKSKLKY